MDSCRNKSSMFIRANVLRNVVTCSENSVPSIKHATEMSLDVHHVAVLASRVPFQIMTSHKYNNCFLAPLVLFWLSLLIMVGECFGNGE